MTQKIGSNILALGRRTINTVLQHGVTSTQKLKLLSANDNYLENEIWAYGEENAANTVVVCNESPQTAIVDDQGPSSRCDIFQIKHLTYSIREISKGSWRLKWKEVEREGEMLITIAFIMESASILISFSWWEVKYMHCKWQVSNRQHWVTA